LDVYEIHFVICISLVSLIIIIWQYYELPTFDVRSWNFVFEKYVTTG
jgi:hypothetical protein